MAEIFFFGRVLPSGWEISVSDPPAINWHDSERNIDVRVELQIDSSNVRVRIETPLFSPDDIALYYTRAMDVLKSAIDLVAFSSGIGISVHLDSWQSPEGTQHLLKFGDPRLEEACTATQGETAFADVLRIVATEPALFMALNDLVMANTLPHVGVINCARAIEGIRHLIAGSDGRQRKAWDLMQQVLNVDEAYLKLITDASKDNRHGNRVFIPGSIAGEVNLRAWNVMNRYLEYRKRGSEGLSAVEFPLLRG